MAKIKNKAAMAARKKARKKTSTGFSTNVAILKKVNTFKASTIHKTLANKSSAEIAHPNTLLDIKSIKVNGYEKVVVNSYTQVKAVLKAALESESFYALESLRHALKERNTLNHQKIQDIHVSVDFCCTRLKEGKISWWNVIKFLNNHYPIYANK